MQLQIIFLNTKHYHVLSIILSCLILLCLSSNCTAADHKETNKQEIPGVCDSACQIGINSANEYTETLHNEQAVNHESLVQRVIKLENEFYESIDRLNILQERIPTIEAYLSGNVSVLNTRITDEVRASYNDALIQLDLARSDWNDRLNNLKLVVDGILNNPGNPGNPTLGNPDAARQVYINVTRRIDTLEYGKVLNLTRDNSMWRNNFRVINTTFEKIKGNKNCLCM